MLCSFNSNKNLIALFYSMIIMFYEYDYSVENVLFKRK